MFKLIKIKNLLKRRGVLKKAKNSDLYEITNEDCLEKYDIDSLVAAISEFYSPEEWEDLMWEERMFIFEGIENGDIEIQNKPTSDNPRKYLNSCIQFFLLLISKQFREIIIGDLFECRSVMQKIGLSRRKVNLVTVLKIFIILIAIIRIRISDFLSKGWGTEKNQ